jgi:hypothetical protein
MLHCANGMRVASGPNRMFSGVTTIAGGARNENLGTYGKMNWCAGWHTISEVTNTSSVPRGTRPPYTWVMARKGGAIKSYKLGGIQLDATAVGEKGIPFTASSTLSLDATALGGLIAGLSATGLMDFTATVSVDGTLSGTATFPLSLDGTATPAADAFPTATGVLGFDSGVDIYGIGYMTADTNNDNTTLSPQNVGSAVWKYVTASGFTAEKIILVLAAIAAGKTTVVDLGGGLATVTFRNIEDTGDAVVADMVGPDRDTVTITV